MSTKRDPRTDGYIDNAAPFAQPILRHLRNLVHEGCPGVTETQKWGMPFFENDGAMVCHMAAFKAHCAFGFWHRGMTKVLGSYAENQESAMGSFGRIARLEDLPADKIVVRFIQEAVKLNASGAPARPRAAQTGAKR